MFHLLAVISSFSLVDFRFLFGLTRVSIFWGNGKSSNPWIWLNSAGDFVWCKRKTLIFSSLKVKNNYIGRMAQWQRSRWWIFKPQVRFSEMLYTKIYIDFEVADSFAAQKVDSGGLILLFEPFQYYSLWQSVIQKKKKEAQHSGSAIASRPVALGSILNIPSDFLSEMFHHEIHCWQYFGNVKIVEI